MHKAYFSELTDYLIWADGNIVEWLHQIDDTQWEQTITSSFPSIKQTALHIVSAERIWLDYWTKTPDPVFLSAQFTGTKSDLIAIWMQISAGLKSFVDAYAEKDYLQPVTFKWPGGGESTMAFWQTFSHFINHATYHRGQLVTMLRQAGFTKLSSTDLAGYYRLI
ncbi:damage-inducible protein DinB [Niastella yeongjuensis]|uniref:Damage-inducible protein DinB n=1 Tax=Niastella yeongjuensis TaxID=354355 RepID=A0A1V9E401_9BACT|nr:DinB family protein [Niastella yeongjuensis]OQP40791.1 damage-inducible protein DinB [Niastella yeongjuensis]SEP01580.1 Uncharacterized damage-inducible protein DinB (forms a four-helix bundle) [Niastella yeongjuensis]